MKILLIKPPYSRLKDFGQAPCFPLGLGYLAATLDRAGYYTRIYHTENPRLAEENIIEDEEAIFYLIHDRQMLYNKAVSYLQRRKKVRYNRCSVKNGSES